MSGLMQILGRAMVIETADLIWHWFDAVKQLKNDRHPDHISQLDNIIDIAQQGGTKTKTAIEQMRFYLFENPSCLYGRMAAAAICLQQNHLAAAIEHLTEVYLKQPSNTMALYALGYCYERSGKQNKAIEYYQDCLKFKNFLQLPRQRLAAIYFKNNQLEKTIYEYEQLKEEYPDDLSTLMILGRLYLAAEKPSEAAETFNNAILMHPDNFHNGTDEIDQLITNNQHYQAVEKLDYLLSQQPERIDLILRKADAMAMMGLDDDSAAQYHQALQICPNFLEATIKLGTHYLRTGNVNAAALLFNKAVEINDQIVESYIGLAAARKLAGNDPEALSTLSLAAAINSNSALLFTETAKLQLRATLAEDYIPETEDDSQNLVETLLTAHRQQITIQPTNPELHYRFGLLMAGVGRMIDAAKAFEIAVKINPTYCQARSKLAVTLFETDQKQLAIAQLTNVRYPDKGTLDLHYKTTLLYCDKIRFASSLIDLDRKMENNFACTNTTSNISIVLQNLGLVDRADATWDNLAETTNFAIKSTL